MYHIIINPFSRSGKGLRIWKETIEPKLQEEGIGYRDHFSEKPGDMARLAGEITSAAAEDLTLIVLGGDGTVNEALSGIKDTSHVILGYIPTGSSNDLARDLNIPKDPLEALNLILHEGSTHTMDLGAVTYADGETRPFIVSCGIGFDAAVCEEALHSKMKNVFNRLGLGKLTYLGIALKQLFGAKAISGRLTLDGQAPVNMNTLLFVACMLHRFEGGGFMFCPNADASDGILDLCAVGDLPKLLILFALPTAFKGKHYRFNGITAYQAKTLTIETSAPLWVHTDGEVARKSDRITVTCAQGAVRMIY
ncbi:MAG: diacylglycerol kinase family lipid kinase [Lachnospiraceae bacterium]|nr:diacylglycerol kinase family lipid kinase [Lachnospiraceae bacterium]MCM1238187.1 diacylglycerol kinase family lipid kinase [Lachnospiraceae bacterium]